MLYCIVLLYCMLYCVVSLLFSFYLYRLNKYITIKTDRSSHQNCYRSDWPQLKRNFISNIINLIYALPRKLPNDSGLTKRLFVW